MTEKASAPTVTKCGGVQLRIGDMLLNIPPGPPEVGRFIGPHLSNGGRVAVQLTDGTLAEGYLYDGQLHDEPPGSGSANPHFGRGNRIEPWRIQLETAFWPNRPPAPWRIRCDDDGQWLIEKRLTDGWETHRYCATGPDAFATFAASGAR